MTLLDQVIRQASDGDAAAMLRKLMIVAQRLEAVQLSTWAKAEVNGYDDTNDIPAYRGPFHVNVKALIVGPGGSKGTSILTKLGLPNECADLFEMRFTEPLAIVEGFAMSNEGVALPWDPAIVGLYNLWIQQGPVPFIPGWGVYSAERLVSHRERCGAWWMASTRMVRAPNLAQARTRRYGCG